MHLPVIISPVTIQRRFNANRDNYEVFMDDKEMPVGVDPRQMSLFGAAWTVGSLKSLFDSDVTSITYYETVGERGLYMGENTSRWPGQFKANKRMIFPAFRIFRTLLNKGKFRVSGSYSTNPLVIDGFTVACEDSGLLFLSNMTRQRIKAMITGIDEYRIILRMNAGNFDALSRNFQLPKAQNQVQMAANSGEQTLQPYETIILEYRL
jgi:hypothetical protein